MNLIRLFVLVLALIGQQVMYSQPNRGYYSVGVSAGFNNYIGDLMRNIDFYKFIRPSIGIMGSYRFDSYLTGRLSLNHGTITADDAQSIDEVLRNRNLSFKSPITELTATIQFDFVPTEGYYYRRAKLTPYVFTGIGLLSFNPKAKLNGEFIDLKPLGTEGQYLTDPEDRYPEPYKLIQVIIPMGIGVRFALARNWDLSMETGYRFTYTDYLDDVSTFYPDLIELRRQNPTAAILSDRSDRSVFPDGLAGIPNAIRGSASTQDGYYMTLVTLSYIIDITRCPK